MKHQITNLIQTQQLIVMVAFFYLPKHMNVPLCLLVIIKYVYFLTFFPGHDDNSWLQTSPDGVLFFLCYCKTRQISSQISFLAVTRLLLEKKKDFVWQNQLEIGLGNLITHQNRSKGKCFQVNGFVCRFYFSFSENTARTVKYSRTPIYPSWLSHCLLELAKFWVIWNSDINRITKD